MKAKLRTIEITFIFIVVLLNAYLVHLNVVVSKYKRISENVSTPNYVEIVDDIKEEVFEEQEEIVVEDTYEGKTLTEISAQIEKSLNSTITGKGYLITSYAIEKGVDPYLATAIILHETGCKWGCSRLVNECNNVGGQKGSGCGSYAYFNSLEEGIMAFVDNLQRNYINYGLTTPETINPKYAEDPNWAKNVNKYIENIKAL